MDKLKIDNIILFIKRLDWLKLMPVVVILSAVIAMIVWSYIYT